MTVMCLYDVSLRLSDHDRNVSLLTTTNTLCMHRAIARLVASQANRLLNYDSVKLF